MRFPAKNCSICLKLFQIEAVISLANFENPSQIIFDMKISRKNPENTRKIEKNAMIVLPGVDSVWAEEEIQ